MTYANLFPDHVRSVIVDGVLDPVAWSNVEAEIPFSTRLRSDAGAQATLDRFFEQCEQAQPGNCAFMPDPADRFDVLATSLLENGPVLIEDPFSGEVFPFFYQHLIGMTLGALYDPFAFALLAQDLAFIEGAVAAADEAGASSAATRITSRSQADRFVKRRGFPNYPNFVEGFPSVGCSDTNNPTDLDVWSSEAAAADAEFGYFGRPWTWASSSCAQWSLDDAGAYEGPYTATTANDVLVVGNLYDPATPYQGAQAVRSLLPNSSLMTVDLAGHVSLGGSGCAGFLQGQYLLDPAVAPSLDGMVCPPEFNPFDVVTGDMEAAADELGLDPQLRTRLLAEIGAR